jgi:hypothetical protein
VQPGVPCDSINNQLNDWILYSRKANIDVNQKELQFAIKGDAKEMYPEIKKLWIFYRIKKSITLI